MYTLYVVHTYEFVLCFTWWKWTHSEWSVSKLICWIWGWQNIFCLFFIRALSFFFFISSSVSHIFPRWNFTIRTWSYTRNNSSLSRVCEIHTSPLREICLNYLWVSELREPCGANKRKIVLLFPLFSSNGKHFIFARSPKWLHPPPMGDRWENRWLLHFTLTPGKRSPFFVRLPVAFFYNSPTSIITAYSFPSR